MSGQVLPNLGNKPLTVLNPPFLANDLLVRALVAYTPYGLMAVIFSSGLSLKRRSPVLSLGER